MKGNKLVLSAISMSALVMLAACGNDESEAQEDGVVTMTTARTLGDDTVFRSGEDVNNNPVVNWARDDLGLNIDTIWTVPNDEQYNTRLRLSMSSGESLPDVFLVSDGQLKADLIESGMVQPIEDAIEEHASDRLKEIFDQFPEAFYPSTNEDGVRYGIPRLSGGNGSDPLLWVRQDWLDNLGLEIPETLEEMEEVMDAFVNQDPNNSGADDTIGVSLATMNGMATWLADSSWIFGAYGDFLPGHWSPDASGELVYGTVQPSIKDGLETLNDWFESGYLDPEVGILDEENAIEQFVAGNAGFLSAPPWGDGWPIGDVVENDPDAVVVPMALPSGEGGQTGRRGEGLITGSFLFNSEFEHIDRYFEYLDEIYGFTLGESDYFADGMFEGYDFIYDENGEVVYDYDAIEAEAGEQRVDPGRYMITRNVPTIPFMLYDLASEFHETDREPENAYEYGIASNNASYLEAAHIVKEQDEHRIENMFTGAPTATMSDRSEHLDRLEQEMIVDIIYGNRPLDYFDEFVEQWRSSGGDQITEEVNAWYDEVTSGN
ncbi:extracellular solute-binding protein [Paenalkalicoccus suaedae]|uniref:Extracellular solute-binding protein n=1 Tax=Paenalkalicoccus suaedae TaxID=2592382 RepID=A0A859FJI3_9BACI|nr:extracellular solute-binding protein [Paenalkalicoccus suaedae]QKS72965.1 extracellular solute-binding protein [Paenalkalicoccus suaedae]